MEYYKQRNNLFTDEFEIGLNDLREYFYQTYKFYFDKEYFKAAELGIWSYIGDKKDVLIKSPTLKPSPEIFFMNHIEKNDVYPIDYNYKKYSEGTLFTVIEILYDHIGHYDYGMKRLDKNIPRKNFSEDINNILKFYNTGYYLEPENGFIMEMPNIAVKKQLKKDVSGIFSDDTLEKYKTAQKMYYRFNSHDEEKRKAINILADILEPTRENLKEILNNEFDISKKKHDKLIFETVNKFNVRHNDKSQIKNYSKDIWFDWMFQYFSSVIIAYYKLNKKYS